MDLAISFGKPLNNYLQDLQVVDVAHLCKFTGEWTYSYNFFRYNGHVSRKLMGYITLTSFSVDVSENATPSRPSSPSNRNDDQTVMEWGTLLKKKHVKNHWEAKRLDLDLDWERRFSSLDIGAHVNSIKKRLHLVMKTVSYFHPSPSQTKCHTMWPISASEASFQFRFSRAAVVVQVNPPFSIENPAKMPHS